MEKQQSELQKLEKSGSEEIYRHIKESAMKSSIRDQAEGTFHEVKGKIKEVAGKLSDNPKLKAEGTVERLAGKVQEKVGQVKKVLGK
jgi:uncharacterized protein YjbJ (UPF0337 family)